MVHDADTIEHVLDAIRSQPFRDRRTIVALAGPPAAGKSTLAAALAGRLNGSAVVFGLDAFHFDDAILDARGDRNRKGAPHTFDLDGYRSMLERLRAAPPAPVALPCFDRSLELTRSAAVLAETTHEVVITEGNWLMLDEDPWRSLRGLFDVTVRVCADAETIRGRIIERWIAHGFDQAEALRRAEENDLPNARLACDRSVASDLTVRTEGF